MIRWMQRMGWRLSALALLALAVRAMVPAGYMVAEADTGSGRYVTIALCEAHGGAPKVVDLETGKILDAPLKGETTNQPAHCVFASVAPVAPPGPVAVPVNFAVVHEIEFAVTRDLRPGRGIAAPPPPATGPPSLA